jgi:hypothetical protein
MNFNTLRKTLGWSLGKCQSVVNKMLATGMIYCKYGEKDNHKTRIFSVTRMQDETIATTPSTKVNELRGKVAVQADIISNLVKVTIDDVKVEVDASLGKFAGIVDIKLSTVMNEILKKIPIGTIVLEKALQKIGFSGIDDERLEKIITADEK